MDELIRAGNHRAGKHQLDGGYMLPLCGRLVPAQALLPPTELSRKYPASAMFGFQMPTEQTCGRELSRDRRTKASPKRIPG